MECRARKLRGKDIHRPKSSEHFHLLRDRKFAIIRIEECLTFRMNGESTIDIERIFITLNKECCARIGSVFLSARQLVNIRVSTCGDPFPQFGVTKFCNNDLYTSLPCFRAGTEKFLIKMIAVPV